MDTVTLVENQISDGQYLLDQLAQGGIEVSAAAWLKPAEDERWSLYIVIPLVESHGAKAAYGEVYGILRSLPDIWITDSDIKLIGEKSRIGRDIIQMLSRFSSRTTPHVMRQLPGGVAVDGVYLYPLAGVILPGFDKLKRQFPSAEIYSFKTKGYGAGMDALGNDTIVHPLIGKVNDAGFEGHDPATLLFMGAKERSALPGGWLVFAYRPEGWNTLYREETQRWEEVRFADSGLPPYRLADFSPLLALKAG